MRLWDRLERCLRAAVIQEKEVPKVAQQKQDSEQKAAAPAVKASPVAAGKVTVTEKYRALVKSQGKRLNGPQFEQYQRELRAERKANAAA